MSRNLLWLAVGVLGLGLGCSGGNGRPDPGVADSGQADTAVADSGSPDTGAPDTGTVDSGAPDTGTSDAGSDAAADAAADAATDAAADAATDAATDAAADAATDAAADAATDAGTDAATDAGTDAATDAGTDAGADAGTDSGTPIAGPGTMPSCTPEATAFAVGTYHWVDVSTTGTRLATVSGADDDSETTPIGFTFPMLGDTFTDANVSSNGFLALGLATSAASYTNVAIPNAPEPNAYVAAMWDDLDPGVGGDIYAQQFGAAPSRALVVQWEAVRFNDTAVPAITFQIILWENGSIEFQYAIIDATDTDARGGGATIGIENTAGTAGIQHSLDSPVLTPDLNLILCRPTTPPV